jgi:hypothetical protein
MALVSNDNSASAIWERTIQPTRTLPPAAARAFLRLKLSGADLKRVDELAAKARSGGLRQAEEQELEHYRAVGTALEFLKSKARLSLKKASR